MRNDVPIVPIVLEGTRDILPKGKLRVQPLPVWVKVLDPVYPRDVAHDWKRLEAVVRERMLEGQRELGVVSNPS